MPLLDAKSAAVLLALEDMALREDGSKAVVFSQFSRTLETLSTAVSASQVLGPRRAVRLDASVPPGQRPKVKNGN